MSLNKYLSNLRQQQNKTKKEIAEAVGCSPSFINDVENGNRSPSLKSAPRWAKALKAPMSEIVRRLFLDQLEKAGLSSLDVQVGPSQEIDSYRTPTGSKTETQS